jgi:hypothetical protein
VNIESFNKKFALPKYLSLYCFLLLILFVCVCYSSSLILRTVSERSFAAPVQNICVYCTIVLSLTWSIKQEIYWDHIKWHNNQQIQSFMIIKCICYYFHLCSVRAPHSMDKKEVSTHLILHNPNINFLFHALVAHLSWKSKYCLSLLCIGHIFFRC